MQPADRTSEGTSLPASGATSPPASADRCFVCDKRVYASERLQITVSGHNRLYHNSGCLKCAKCSRALSATNFALYGTTVLCKPHHREAFLTKGKYDTQFEFNANDPAASAHEGDSTTPGVSVTSPGGERETKENVGVTTPPAQAADKDAPSSVTVAGAKNKLTAASTPAYSNPVTLKAPPERSVRPKSPLPHSAENKCFYCSKTVYVTEKLEITISGQNRLYHKGCLQCAKCSTVLTANSFAVLGTTVYCKPHQRQIFLETSTYNDKPTPSADIPVNAAQEEKEKAEEEEQPAEETVVVPSPAPQPEPAPVEEPEPTSLPSIAIAVTSEQLERSSPASSLHVEAADSPASGGSRASSQLSDRPEQPMSGSKGGSKHTTPSPVLTVEAHLERTSSSEGNREPEGNAEASISAPPEPN